MSIRTVGLKDYLLDVFTVSTRITRESGLSTVSCYLFQELEIYDRPSTQMIEVRASTRGPRGLHVVGPVLNPRRCGDSNSQVLEATGAGPYGLYNVLKQFPMI